MACQEIFCIYFTPKSMAWVASAIAGNLLGSFVPDGAWGLDYALPAMFICLLAFQIRDALQVL